VVRDPSEKPQQACGACHGEVVKNASTSLHYTQNGYLNYLKTMGADVNSPAVQEAFKNHCADCHTTCGQCHISRPTTTEGGLLAGHTVKKVASLSDTCMVCHAARVGDEYRGNYEGVDGDVHWVKLGMACVACHQTASLHGDGQTRTNMYDKPETTCLTCHPNVLTDNKVQQHTLHGNKVACQVCHAAGSYKNCTNCHVGKDAKGLPYRQLDPSWMDFKIGKNPTKTADRPWDYVLVRHVPTNADLFAGYGITLTNPTAVSSWRPATPHNIQRKTPQTESCNNCHGNTKLFLTKDSVNAQELVANKSVIVDTIPPKMGQ
jgi:thiosulfate/3-mercaptopyruvate sulfurtransferase